MKPRNLALLAGASMAVSSATAFAADQVPQLSVNARLVHADGATGSTTRSPNPMVVAQGVTTYVFAADNLCGLGAAKEGARTLNELRSGHVWKVTRTGVAHQDGRLTFDLDWVRYDPGRSAPSANGRQRLTLAEGATYPIDLIRTATPGSCNAAAVVLEIEADAIEQPAFADTVLTYDVWLTHKDADGRKQTKHIVISGKQGKSSEFDFSPFRFDVPKLAPDQYDLDLVTRVMGAVKGRLRGDGKVDVDLETRRLDRLERSDEPKPPLAKAGGRKTLEVLLGETIEIELPQSSGVHAHVASPQSSGISGRLGVGAAARGTPPAGPAVDLKDGAIIVNIKQFFERDRFSVLIRVRKEGQD
jgi:hypothetical protein